MILRLAADMTVCLVLVAVRMAESLGTARSATRYIVGLEIIKMHKVHGVHYLFSLFSLCVSVCTPTRQVEHQRCSRTGRVKKSQSFKEKHNIYHVRHLTLSFPHTRGAPRLCRHHPHAVLLEHFV